MQASEISEFASAILPSVSALLRQVWMPDDWFKLTDQVAKHYACKAAVCALTQRSESGWKTGELSIIEIGTRCGYSAAVFRQAAPTSKMLCFDGAADPDSDRCLAWAEKTFASADVTASIVRVNTVHVKAVPFSIFAHVDGDHSHDGCLRDLRLVSKSRVILADDADNPSVASAIRQFVAETQRSSVWVDDGLRKAVVIE
jgi:hypothetical protein